MNNLVGKRMLLKVGTRIYNVAVQEYKVIEISPSGNWLKLQNMSGNKFWSAVTEIAVVEELRDLKADKPSNV